ncbi:endo-1,3;1,4-beta-D-glucanase-like [Zingiber officinale]|uniref:endo-1,3;1,4-beta-D-glucanase-like n=1 Tax=Zingiber officinale TaxID=94328 RepID=UPI001C4B2E3B|nr:endo-1,3;1,4-beta-D-glucanase-like [Zingiber officinale]
MAGAQCCENPPALSSASGQGSVVESIGGLKAYTAGSSNSKAAVVLVSDVYGYEAPNLRKLADKVAAAGFFVVVPDFFYGDPYAPNPEKPVMMWLENHGTDKGFEDAKSVIEYLKSKGIEAIGAAGFCWGGKVVTELAKTDYVKAVVMLHPSMVKLDDITEIKRPTSILAAETDSITPAELVKQFEEILSTKTEVDSFVKIFAGAAHGWTVRYDTNNEAAVAKAEEAHKDLMDWFHKYLK